MYSQLHHSCVHFQNIEDIWGPQSHNIITKGTTKSWPKLSSSSKKNRMGQGHNKGVEQIEYHIHKS